MKKKSQVTPQTTTTASGTLPDPLPTVGAPSAPSTFDPTKGGIPRGNPPRGTQIQAAGAVASELDANSAEYESVFGTKAPSPTAFAAALVIGAGWSVQRTAAALWFAYCRSEEAKAWKPIMATATKLRPILTGVVASDPSVATSFPELTAFINAAVPAGKKAAASRKAGTNATQRKIAKAAATVARAAAKAPRASSSGSASAPTPNPPPPTPGGVH